MRTRPFAVVFAGVLVVLMLPHVVWADPPEKPVAKPEEKKALREIRVAVFDFDVLPGVKIEAPALTDQINALLATLPKVTIVNRTEIQKVADEHKMVLTGLVDPNSAVKLGKFLSAQYVMVGRAGKIGNSYYLVTRLIDVETTVQTTVSTKSSAGRGVDVLLAGLKRSLVPQIKKLQQPIEPLGDPQLAKVRKLAKPVVGKTFLLSVEEKHVNRPLQDPAAQMAVAHRLRKLGIHIVLPKDPEAGWKKELLLTGRFEGEKIDYLLEGEGVSAFAGRVYGHVSARARVELRLIKVPGNKITVIEKGVAAAVDLVESLAAKEALERAGTEACDRVVESLAHELLPPEEGKKEEKKEEKKQD